MCFQVSFCFFRLLCFFPGCRALLLPMFGFVICSWFIVLSVDNHCSRYLTYQFSCNVDGMFIIWKSRWLSRKIHIPEVLKYVFLFIVLYLRFNVLHTSHLNGFQKNVNLVGTITWKFVALLGIYRNIFLDKPMDWNSVFKKKLIFPT